MKTAFFPLFAAVVVQFVSSNAITVLMSEIVRILSVLPGIAPYMPQIVLFIAALLISVFFYAPLIVGTTKLVLDVSRGKPADYTAILTPFKKENYFSIVKAMSVRMLISQLMSELMSIITRLYIFVYVNKRLPALPSTLPQYSYSLAALVFAALGIFLTYKSFEYFLIEYIVADDYSIKLSDALRKTKNYMKGNKLATLILAFSLIGWYFLGALAFMVGIIFVQVYMQAIIAQLYFELSGEHNIIHSTCEDV